MLHGYFYDRLASITADPFCIEYDRCTSLVVLTSAVGRLGLMDAPVGSQTVDSGRWKKKTQGKD